MTQAKNGERAWRTSYTCSEFQILLTSVVMYIHVTSTSGHGCQGGTGIKIPDRGMVGWFLHRSVKIFLEVCETDRLNSFFEGI